VSGDLPLEPRLKTLHEDALSRFEKIDTKHTDVHDEKRWNEPRFYTVSGPPAPCK
jgi:hypothetical protein